MNRHPSSAFNDDIPEWPTEAFPLAGAIAEMRPDEAAAQLAALGLRLDAAVLRVAADLYEQVNPNDYSDLDSWLDARAASDWVTRCRRHVR